MLCFFNVFVCICILMYICDNINIFANIVWYESFIQFLESFNICFYIIYLPNISFYDMWHINILD